MTGATNQRRSRTAHALLVTAALSAAGATACGDDDTAQSIARIDLTASKSEEDPSAYAFDMPSTARAGWTEFTLTNTDDEQHHAQLLRLNDDASFESLIDVLATGGPEAGFELGTLTGGTSLVAPGDESQVNAIVDLEAGTYAVICLVPGPDGTPHVAHGMARELVVTGSDDSSPPAAAVTARLFDYGFDVPNEFDGTHMLAVANDGTEAHEMVIARLDDGASIDEVIDAMHSGTPPPFTPVGGLQAIPPGPSARLRLHLAPGRYAAICFVPSADGTPHVDKGMIKEVTIT